MGVIIGFFAWMILWFGAERILSAVWEEFGAHQAAFQAAVEHGGQFVPITNFLLVHCVLASIVSFISGAFSALLARENKRAPLILGLILLTMGLLKAVMSWTLVPIWYNILFMAVLLPMTILGGKLKSRAR